MLSRGFVIIFALKPSNLITTLTKVLMDTFCPCFLSDFITLKGIMIFTKKTLNIRFDHYFEIIKVEKKTLQSY